MNPEDDTYLWDVFVSYGRTPTVERWIAEHFLPFLRDFLSLELDGREPKIFFDQTDIRTGAKWRHSIAEAAHRSRCLVAIWTPKYFYSTWCMAEWNYFLERTEAARLGAQGLAFPIVWHGEPQIPDSARRVMYEDFSSFALVGPAFEKSELYLEFQSRTKELARSLASVIRAAPVELPSTLFSAPESPDIEPPRIERVQL